MNTLSYQLPENLAGAVKAALSDWKSGNKAKRLCAARESRLQTIRHAVRDKKHVACLGFGPRFLHSTGQAYEGGPNTGVFLQVTCDDAADIPVPQQKYSFGVVKAAQARGDFQVLVERGRRALRVHLGTDLEAGLNQLQKAIEKALA